jgi:histidinol-phosphatase (PHP family)
MLKAAEKSGLKIVGISEHIYQISEVRSLFPDFIMEGKVYGLEEYIEILNTNRKNKLRLLSGIEMDYIPGFTDAATKIISKHPWDYIIGSVHEINKWDIHLKREYSIIESHEKWREYLNYQIEMIKTGRVNILGHPTRMYVTVKEILEDIGDAYDQLAKLAKSYGVAVEINFKDCLISSEMVNKLLIACRNNNTMITVGSDAHTNEIVRDYSKIEELLSKNHISQLYHFINGTPYPIL